MKERKEIREDYFLRIGVSICGYNCSDPGWKETKKFSDLDLLDQSYM